MEEFESEAGAEHFTRGYIYLVELFQLKPQSSEEKQSPVPVPLNLWVYISYTCHCSTDHHCRKNNNKLWVCKIRLKILSVNHYHCRTNHQDKTNNIGQYMWRQTWRYTFTHQCHCSREYQHVERRTHTRLKEQQREDSPAADFLFHCIASQTSGWAADRR